MARPRFLQGAYWQRPRFLASVVIASMIVVILIQVWELRFSPRSSTIATIVELVGPNSSASLLGTTVRVEGQFDNATATEKDREAVLAACGPDFPGLTEPTGADGFILRKPVMVLHVSDEGIICLEEGEVRSFGSVDVRARHVGRVVGEDDIVHEVSIRESEPWIAVAVATMTLLLTLFLGAAISVWLDRSYRESTAADIASDVRVGMADAKADDRP
jgi:hypothetical protein